MVLSNSFHTFVDNAFGNKKDLLRSTYTARASLNSEKIEEKAVFGGNISEEFLQKADLMLKRGGQLEVFAGWNMDTREEIHENNQFQRALAKLVEADEFASMTDTVYKVAVATRSGLRGLNVVKFNEEASKLLDEINALPPYKEEIEVRRELHKKKALSEEIEEFSKHLEEEFTEDMDVGDMIAQVLTKCETVLDRDLTNEEIGRITKIINYYAENQSPWMSIDIAETLADMLGGEDGTKIKKSLEPAIASLEQMGVERPSFDENDTDNDGGADDDAASDEEIDEAREILTKAGYVLEEEDGDEVLDVELAGKQLQPTKIKFNPSDNPTKKPIVINGKGKGCWGDFRDRDDVTAGQKNAVKKALSVVASELSDEEKAALEKDGGEPYDLQLDKQDDGKYNMEVTDDNGKKIKDIELDLPSKKESSKRKLRRNTLKEDELNESEMLTLEDIASALDNSDCSYSWIGDDMLEVTTDYIADEEEMLYAVQELVANELGIECGPDMCGLQVSFVAEEEGFYTYDLSFGGAMTENF